MQGWVAAELYDIARLIDQTGDLPAHFSFEDLQIFTAIKKSGTLAQAAEAKRLGSEHRMLRTMMESQGRESEEFLARLAEHAKAEDALIDSLKSPTSK